MEGKFSEKCSEYFMILHEFAVDDCENTGAKVAEVSHGLSKEHLEGPCWHDGVLLQLIMGTVIFVIQEQSGTNACIVSFS